MSAVSKQGVTRDPARVILDVQVVQVKGKSESKEAGDIYKRLNTIPAAKAFMPLSENKCRM